MWAEHASGPCAAEGSRRKSARRVCWSALKFFVDAVCVVVFGRLEQIRVRLREYISVEMARGGPNGPVSSDGVRLYRAGSTSETL